MDSQRLQLLLQEIQISIDDFKKRLSESENQHYRALKLIADPELSSLLMEEQAVYIKLQRTALSRMENLLKQVRDQLSGPNRLNYN